MASGSGSPRLSRRTASARMDHEVIFVAAFFQERCVATESTVNFVPLPFAWRGSGSAPADPTMVTELRYMSFSFFCPIFLRHPKARATAPKASGCIPGGTRVVFGRNRESRRREAAGRRNSPEAVPRKRSGRKRPCTGIRQNRKRPLTRQASLSGEGREVAGAFEPQLSESRSQTNGPNFRQF